MKRLQCLRYAAAAIASLGFVLPSGVLAADAQRAGLIATAAEMPAILDVGLSQGGSLFGQVLDSQGTPLTQTLVTIRSQGADVASTVTDARGSFSVGGLQGGVYEVRSAGGSSIFRLWTAAASPPSAHSGVLIVAGQDVSRGQGNIGRITNGHVLVGVALVLGVAGGIVAATTGNGNHEQQSGS